MAGASFMASLTDAEKRPSSDHSDPESQPRARVPVDFVPSKIYFSRRWGIRLRSAPCAG